MKVVLKLLRRGTKGNNLIGEQIGLNRRDAIAVDTLNSIQRTQQVDKLLARGATKVAGIDSRNHNFALTGSSNLLGLGNNLGNRDIATRASGVVNRTVSALIVATILHLQESAGSVPRRKGCKEARQMLDIATENLLYTTLFNQFNHSFI